MRSPSSHASRVFQNSVSAKEKMPGNDTPLSCRKVIISLSFEPGHRSRGVARLKLNGGGNIEISFSTETKSDGFSPTISSYTMARRIFPSCLFTDR